MAYDDLSMDSMPDYEIVRFYCGVTTHSEMTILCHGKRFHIHISAEDLHGNLQLENEYLERLWKLEIEDEMLPIHYNDWQKTLIEAIDKRQEIEGRDDDNDNFGRGCHGRNLLLDRLEMQSIHESLSI